MVSYGDTTDNVISLYCSYGRDHILSASQIMITAYEMTGVDHHGHEGRKKGSYTKQSMIPVNR